MKVDDPIWVSYRDGLELFVNALQVSNLEDIRTFRSALKIAINYHGIIAGDLADKLGHSRASVSKWLNTTYSPPRSTREKVCRFILEQMRKKLEELNREILNGNSKSQSAKNHGRYEGLRTNTRS